MYEYRLDFIKNIYSLLGFIQLHGPHFIGNNKKYSNEAPDTTYVSSACKFLNKVKFNGKVLNLGTQNPKVSMDDLTQICFLTISEKLFEGNNIIDI